MFGRLILGTLLGGVVKSFTNGDTVGAMIGSGVEGRGIYVYPDNPHEPGLTEEQIEVAKSRWESEPLIFVSYRGRSARGMAAAMITSLIRQPLAALLITAVVLQCRGSSYVGHVLRRYRDHIRRRTALPCAQLELVGVSNGLDPRAHD